ncbi:hypothetical protein DPEC_G00279350 [Dallia pectoralis]|uniref:Uncharacterized protein n=1 Tax=Dallia pectoralis TaxID=75939 RepID=A0ACC2FMC4_DALPE|nr:hypothetical protein DPEC_G00279350 [Dallia pectoralis]
MKWNCKYCRFDTSNQQILIRHYKLKHGHYARSCPLPCIHQDCPCNFKTEIALKRHLTQHRKSFHDTVNACLKCDHCNFLEPCNVKQYFSHLRIHFDNNETVQCPFQDCSFKSVVHSSFKSHRSRKHCFSTTENFRPELITNHAAHVCASIGDTETGDISDLDVLTLNCASGGDDSLEESLKHKLASLFLRMQTILHVSKAATQEIVEELCTIGSVSSELTKKAIKTVLLKNNCTLEDSSRP